MDWTAFKQRHVSRAVHERECRIVFGQYFEVGLPLGIWIEALFHHEYHYREYVELDRELSKRSLLLPQVLHSLTLLCFICGNEQPTWDEEQEFAFLDVMSRNEAMVARRKFVNGQVVQFSACFQDLLLKLLDEAAFCALGWPNSSTGVVDDCGLTWPSAALCGTRRSQALLELLRLHSTVEEAEPRGSE